MSRKPRRSKCKRRRWRPLVERLERRDLLAADSVDLTADSIDASLDGSDGATSLDDLVFTPGDFSAGDSGISSDPSSHDGGSPIPVGPDSSGNYLDDLAADPSIQAGFATTDATSSPPAARHNGVNPPDVDVSGTLTSLDALLVINAINNGQASEGESSRTDGELASLIDFLAMDVQHRPARRRR